MRLLILYSVFYNRQILLLESGKHMLFIKITSIKGVPKPKDYF